MAYWVYRDNDPEKTGRTFTEEYFGLDDAGTLWNWKKLYSIDEEYMETEIAENVRSMVHYEGRAGLISQSRMSAIWLMWTVQN